MEPKNAFVAPDYLGLDQFQGLSQTGLSQTKQDKNSEVFGAMPN